MIKLFNTFVCMSRPVSIFIIYAREDAATRDELVKALSPLQLQNWVQSWHDGHIKPGELWDQKIRHSLETADIVLPIISNDYFSSEYIQQIEIARAFERFNAGKCRIVPVIARACAWESDIRLAKLQALPPGGTAIGSWPNRDEALQSIVSGITLLVRPDHQPGLYTDIPSTGSGPLPWRKKHRLALLVSVILLVVLAGLAGRYFIQDGTPVNPTTILEFGNGEHSDFEKALSAGTIPAMRAFLRQYPDGIKAGDAGNAIQNLQKELDFNVASAFQLIEGDEWKAATDAYDKAFRINPDDPKLHALQEKIKRIRQ
jgi:hypothetical protein